MVLVVFPYFIYYIIRNINAAKITRNISDRTIREIGAFQAQMGVQRS
ncbi:MAG: hypothetical protein IPP17_28580 [Bacteroidetes bacterium]|nr:hypothetical protein [Bacteroidota bacterium]